MRTVPKWINKIHEAEKTEYSCVQSLCYSPDGTQMIVAASERVMVYDPQDGSLIRLLRGHKDTVYCVAYAKDGRKFASGGADKIVIIWTSKLEGVLKYSHNEPLQCLAYNPITHQLTSCAVSDIAFWSNEVKAVQKHRVNGSGRITCCSWSLDGQLLAVGLSNGFVSIRDKNCEERLKISREGCPVWSVLWTESALLVGDWSETLSFYNASGQQVMKDRPIGLMPVCLNRLGELILVCGVKGWIITTLEGVPVLKNSQQWVWSIEHCDNTNTIALGCLDGTLWCYQIVFNKVHGLYHEKYAYRENLTDVIIHHLTSGTKVKIKCHDKVQKIAIYKHRLAVQLPERIVIYEQSDTDGMLYRVKEKIPQKAECSLLVATSSALLLCQDAKLVMIGGKNLASWNVPASIKFVKVTTVQNKEALLLGLANGEIWKVDLDEASMEVLVTIESAIRCFDLSSSKSMIAIVDESCCCHVYMIATQQLLFTAENASSVSWHATYEDLLCYSGGGMLSIKLVPFPESSQPVIGSVVGFQKGHVFCLQANAMQSINVPLSHAMHQYIQNHMFNEAYNIACLGVPNSDWESLGFAALEELSLSVAKKAFQRIENVLFLELVDVLEEMLNQGDNASKALSVAEVYAYRGKFIDAARLYRSNGQSHRALTMYTDLRLFHKAQEYMDSEDVSDLIKKRAEWAQHINEPRVAAEMFLAAGDIKSAANIMAQNGWVDMLVETGRNLDKGASDNLYVVAQALISIGHLESATELYQKLGDQHAMVKMAVKMENWEQAFQLVKQNPEYKEEVYIPYAQQMARDNHFIEAHKAYHMGGQTESAARVLGVLIQNAIAEERFNDAAYLHWLLASQSLEISQTVDDIDQQQNWIESYNENEKYATIYFTFHIVHQSIHEVFSVCQPETLFNAAKIVLSLVENNVHPPKGISLFSVYLCLAKQGRLLGANKLARQMLDKIQNLKVPFKIQENVEVLTLLSRAGLNDSNEVTPLCYRCSHHFTPLSTVCNYCGHNLYHSFLTFEVVINVLEILPLVAFTIEDDITVEEALQLIESDVSSLEARPNDQENSQILRIENLSNLKDVFSNKSFEDDKNGKVVCNREDLKILQPLSVIVINRPKPLETLFFRNVMPDLHIQYCPHCYKLFYVDDLESQLISKALCSFCRSQLIDGNGTEPLKSIISSSSFSLE
ncbi:intraflagellar transport protein 122 homolog [Arctopsyche grandis]|uniref:intraflagellar transport protein 122 homolog n=1 Tax=Arctopsyche grandis TaxID=121162 RepID=UPI00406D7880